MVIDYIYRDVTKFYYGCLFTKRQNFRLSKLKAFADDNLNVAQTVKFLFDSLKNIVRKREILITSIFSFSHNVFIWPLFQSPQLFTTHNPDF